MNKLEKAIRYLCAFETESEETKVNRYNIIEELVSTNDERHIDKYAKKYEQLAEMLNSSTEEIKNSCKYEQMLKVLNK